MSVPPIIFAGGGGGGMKIARERKLTYPSDFLSDWVLKWKMKTELRTWAHTLQGPRQTEELPLTAVELSCHIVHCSRMVMDGGGVCSLVGLTINRSETIHTYFLGSSTTVRVIRD